MDLDEVRAFVTVVDTGSFKAAATTSGLPRGTLRRRVSALETRVGVALLDRDRTGVSATTPGLKLLRHGRQIIRDADSLFRTLRSLRGTGTHLRFGLPLGMPPEGIHKLVMFTERFFQELSIDLRFSEDPARELMQSVDVAFSFYAPPQAQFVARPVVEMRMGLRASREYLERHGLPKTIDDLRHHRLLAWLGPRNDRTRWPLLRGGALDVEPVFATPDYQLLRQLAIRGAGVAMLPDVNLPDLDPGDRKLVRVLPNLVGGRHHMYMVVPDSMVGSDTFEHLTAGLSRFLSMMVPKTTLEDWVASA